MNWRRDWNHAGVRLTRNVGFFARGAFTKVELLVVVVVMAIVVGLAVPALSKASAKAKRISCVGRLKNIGLANRIFATDNHDLFPWETNFTRLRDLTPAEQVVHLYRTLSNELSTPKIIICPADSKKAALNWQQLTTNNISYFLGIGAAETYPQSLLAGDRNLTLNGQPIQGGRVEIQPAANLGWDRTIHELQGNIAMGDGSVQQLSSSRVQEQLRNTGTTNNTLLIP